MAKADYREASQRINALQQQLAGATRKASRKTLRPVREILPDVLPRDRLFTVGEAYQLLCATDPKRYFHLPSVRHIFAMMNQRGEVRRVRRTAQQVYWAVPEFKEIESEYGAQTLRSIAEQVLRKRGPMRVTEIVVVIQSKGYRPDADPRVLARSLGTTMSHCPERFSYGKDGRWGVVK